MLKGDVSLTTYTTYGMVLTIMSINQTTYQFMSPAGYALMGGTDYRCGKVSQLF